MATAPHAELLTPGQMKDLTSAAVQGVPSDLSRGLADLWIGQKGMLGEEIRRIFYAGPFPDIDWPLTYLKLGMEAEAEAAKKIVLPPRDTLIWWVPMVQGTTSNRIVSGMRNLGVGFYLYEDDLDVAVPTHDRDPNRDGSYVIGFRRTIEADEENKNLSANQLKERNHKGITLPERLLLGAGFFVATGQYLDVKNETLCAGSRFSDGRVPHVHWPPGPRKVCVSWSHPDHCHHLLCSRSAQFPLPA